MVKKGNRGQSYLYLSRMWSPWEFCRNCWVGMLDYPKPGCYSILDYAPKIPIKLISFRPNDTQCTRTKLSYFYTRLQTKLRMLGNHTFHSGLNTGAGHTYITHTWGWVTMSSGYIYILYIMGTEIRRLTPYIMSIMKSLLIPAIGLALSSVIYSRVTLVLFFALGDWFWKPANNTVENNGAVGYFGSSLTVYNSLFFYSQIVTK